MKTFSLLCAMILAWGCASQPSDSSQPGTCKLDCSTRHVPSAEFKIVPMLGDVTITCANAPDGVESFDFSRPVAVRFKVVKSHGDGGEAGGDAGGGDAGGGEGLQADQFEDAHIPGVGFEPWVLGGVSVANTNEEHRIDVSGQAQAEPAKYAGIVTPSSEWCSDSCGVMTYEVWPSCITGKDNEVTASVLSGGVIPDKPTKITLSHEDDSGSGLRGDEDSTPDVTGDPSDSDPDDSETL